MAPVKLFSVLDRITAAVEKVELLWQQAFSKARLQLQVSQLREEALQVSQWTTVWSRGCFHNLFGLKENLVGLV